MGSSGTSSCFGGSVLIVRSLSVVGDISLTLWFGPQERNELLVNYIFVINVMQLVSCSPRSYEPMGTNGVHKSIYSACKTVTPLWTKARARHQHPAGAVATGSDDWGSGIPKTDPILREHVSV